MNLFKQVIKYFCKPQVIFLSLLLATISSAQQTEDIKLLKNNYIQLSGWLFEDVQLSKIFPDSKTFVDAVPKIPPQRISFLYDSLKTKPDFNLKKFVSNYFYLPVDSAEIKIPPNQDINERIKYLWDLLKRNPDKTLEHSTLIALPNSYIVPGGRFREIYYWDTYFTLLGLLADDKIELAENLLDNFAFLIEKYGHIPNGNRVYYLTRSQPPFFALMISAVSQFKDSPGEKLTNKWALKYLNALEKEYSFWMKGIEKLNWQSGVAQRVVMIDSNGTTGKLILNRYYDLDTIPREESYAEDFETAQKYSGEKSNLYRNLRAAAESGWDFSSRWFEDTTSIEKCITTDIIPVDLNCLLFFMEKLISEMYLLEKDFSNYEMYKLKAETRAILINKYCWNDKEKFYFDYNWKKKQQSNVYSLAGCFPLYFGIASKEQAEFVKEKLETKFLKYGGLVTTPYKTNQQWDAPNGWAPLQWIAVKGLQNYGLTNLADSIKLRWVRINEEVFNRTGKMFEKYNVEINDLQAGGGEYPLQDGFGWTNGVYSAFKKGLDKKLIIKTQE